MDKKKLKEAVVDKILSTFLKGPNKATQRFLKKQIEKDPELKAKVAKSKSLASALDKSNDEVIAGIYNKWKGTEFEKYFQQ